MATNQHLRVEQRSTPPTTPLTQGHSFSQNASFSPAAIHENEYLKIASARSSN